MRNIPFLSFIIALLILISVSQVLAQKGTIDVDSDLSLDLAQLQKNPDPLRTTIIKNEVQEALTVTTATDGSSTVNSVDLKDKVVPEATKTSSENIIHPEHRSSEEISLPISSPSGNLQQPQQPKSQQTNKPSATPSSKSDILKPDDNMASPVPAQQLAPKEEPKAAEEKPKPMSSETAPSNDSGREKTPSPEEKTPSPEEKTPVQGESTGPNLVKIIIYKILSVFKK